MDYQKVLLITKMVVIGYESFDTLRAIILKLIVFPFINVLVKSSSSLNPVINLRARTTDEYSNSDYR